MSKSYKKRRRRFDDEFYNGSDADESSDKRDKMRDRSERRKTKYNLNNTDYRKNEND
jgi:hypothetical protein